MDHGNGTVSVGSENQFAIRIEGYGINPLANGSVVITFPLVASITANTLLRHPMNSRELAYPWPAPSAFYSR